VLSVDIFFDIAQSQNKEQALEADFITYRLNSYHAAIGGCACYWRLPTD
jgi:hypothetical protein